MEGRCPGCNRAYDISEEFLSMGGKAKCPHCLLELEFDGSGSASAEDRAHDVTRADDREHRMSYDAAADEAVEADESDEVDSHCPACERRYKVDRKYLELGGAAQCPHCAVDLIFDSTGAPATSSGYPLPWKSRRRKNLRWKSRRRRKRRSPKTIMPTKTGPMSCPPL
jgi:hypothetical protein